MRFAVFSTDGLWSVVDLEMTRSVWTSTRIGALRSFLMMDPGPACTKLEFLAWWSKMTPQILEFRRFYEATDINGYMESIESAHQKVLSFEVHFLTTPDATAPDTDDGGGGFYDVLMSENKS